MTESFAAVAPHLVAAGSGGARTIGYILGLIIFIVLVVDVWRSNASTGAKVGWTIFGFFCTIIALIVWLVWGKKKYGGPVGTQYQ